jgi:hypothetical protein
MKLMSSVLLDPSSLWGCTAYSHETSVETFRRGFELCVVARDSTEATVTKAVSSTGDAFLINLPAALSSSDVSRARAVTKSSWYMLSGSHRTSTLLLKLKSGPAAHFRSILAEVISRGGQIAILLNGEVIGVLMFNHQLTGDEIAIDASFFSDGTEKEKESDTRNLALQINSTLY